MNEYEVPSSIKTIFTLAVMHHALLQIHIELRQLQIMSRSLNFSEKLKRFICSPDHEEENSVCCNRIGFVCLISIFGFVLFIHKLGLVNDEPIPVSLVVILFLGDLLVLAAILNKGETMRAHVNKSFSKYFNVEPVISLPY